MWFELFCFYFFDIYRLHFAELFFNSVNDRVFDIEIENEIVEYRFDILDRAGGRDHALIKEYYDICVTDHTLRIKFLKDGNDPKVNGIEIYQI